MAQKVLRVGWLISPRTLDPLEGRDIQSVMTCAQIYETPCAVGRADQPAQPLLFQSMAREDELHWSGTIRPGIVFSDGTPLTAELAARAMGRSQFIREQARVESRGDRVCFSLQQPNARFDLALTLPQSSVVLDKGGALFGTGAYLPAPGSTLEALRLVRNPHHRRPVAIDEVRIRIYPTDPDGKPTALLEALGRGDVDFTNALPRREASSVTGMRIQIQPANSTAVLFLNTERPGLNQPEMRRALALAIDRFAIAEQSYSVPLAFVATELLPPIMSGGFHDQLTHDLDRAKALLQKVAGPRPSRLKLLIMGIPRPYLPAPRQTAEVIARQIQALGVEVTPVVARTTKEFYEQAMPGDYDLLPGGWIADTLDPADFLESLLRSDRVPRAGGLPFANWSHFRSPAMDAALAGFRRDPGPTQRAAVLQILAEQAPLVPLLYGPDVVVSSRRLLDLTISPSGTPDFGGADLAP